MADQQVDYDALAKQFGATASQPKQAAPVDYDALAKANGAMSASRAPASGRGSSYDPNEKSWFSDLVTEALSGLNPQGINSTVQSAFWHPIDTVKAIGKAQGDLETKAEDAFKRGDYKEGVRHALSYLIPILGPRIDQAGDYAQKGDYAKAAGATIDVASQVALPEMASRMPGSLPIVRGLSNPNPVAAEAVRFGEQHGIPIDAATSTGSPIVATIQKRVTDTMGGAGTAERFKAAQSQSLATVGEQLAAKANARNGVPGPSVTAEQAGQGVQDAVRSTVAGHAADADAAYGRLRTIENDPAHTRSAQVGTDANGAPVVQDVPLPVDLRGSKAALSPVYQRLKRESELVSFQAGTDKARALTALDRLMNGPDAASLSTVDGALSDLKALARADIPELRTTGQGMAAEAVKQLDAQVRATATQAGPDAIRALDEGRAATIAKHEAGDVLEDLLRGTAEPVGTYNTATAPRDGAINRLRAIKTHAPDQLPQIGRAYLDRLMDHAQRDGGFTNAAGLSRSWDTMGRETKNLLFQDPAYIRELDNFFRLSKRIGENPNPSGTARVNNVFNAATQVPAFAISKLLYSPRGVRLLTRGLTLPVKSPVAVGAWTAEVSKALGDLGAMGMPAPAVAQNGQEGKPQ